MAQSPGARTPQGMSGVSSLKMPEHVPKVNSRWDGMPRRANEQDERTDSRSGSRTTSARTSSTRSRSANRDSCDGHHSRQILGNTASSKHVNQRTSNKNGHQAGLRADSGEVDSLLGRVSGSYSPTKHQSKSVLARTQSPRSPARRSPPQITSFFPNDIPELPGVCQLPALSPDPAQRSTGEGVTQCIPRTEEPIAEDNMDHKILGNASPREHSPVTPLCAPSVGHQVKSDVETDDSLSFPVLDRSLSQLVFHSSRLHGQDPPVATRKVSKEANTDLLAGEARPLQFSNGERSLTPGSILKMDTTEPALANSSRVRQDLEERPDSSRSRLGLKASMIKSSDAVPWEADKKTDPRSGVLNQALSPRDLRSRGLGIFGRT